MNDGLPDPPDGIRDEFDFLSGVEALGGLDQPDVPLVDQVEERQPASAIALGVGDDEAQIGLDELAQGLSVVFLDLGAELALLGGRDPRQTRYLLEVLLEGLRGAAA